MLAIVRTSSPRVAVVVSAWRSVAGVLAVLLASATARSAEPRSPVRSPASPENAGTLFVTQAVYDVVPQNDRLQLTAELQLRQTGNETQRLSLPLGGMNLESATLEGQPAAIVRGRDSLVLVHRKAGRAKLRLVLSTPFHRVGGGRVAIVPLIPDAPGTMRAELPAGQSLWINGVRAMPVKAKTGKTVQSLPVGNHRRATLRISTGRSLPRVDAVTLANSSIHLTLSAGMAEWRSETRLHVTGPPRKEFVASVPAEVHITSVTADGLTGWRLGPAADSDSRRSIHLRFQRAFADGASIAIRGRAALGEDRFWSVPNLWFNDVDSHAGRLTIAFSSREKIRVDEPVGIRQTAAESPAFLRRPLKSPSFPKSRAIMSVRCLNFH
ncbi:MAG: hypothetical protein ACE5KM_25075, partial [Planctomycetaceae bacterium]